MSSVLSLLLTLSSGANVLGGSVLFLTWAVNRAADPERHVPMIVLWVALSMIVQGFYSAGYSLGWWKRDSDASRYVLLGGQLLLLFAGLTLLIAGFTTMPRSSHGDFEPAPILAGLMITANALLALVAVAGSGGITRKTRARGAA